MIGCGGGGGRAGEQHVVVRGVTLRLPLSMRRACCGVPAVLQDPLHYPHGTKFLAPGPLGQCHPIPGVW
jgi:hypothetical protein